MEYLKYLEKGKSLILLNPNSKTPCDSGWTTNEYDKTEIESHNGNLGWRLGSNDVVLDIDPRNGGQESFFRLCADLKLSLQGTVTTAGGGFHVYFKLPSSMVGWKFKKELPEYKGIDFLTKGRYVVIAGSVVDDKFYRFALPQGFYQAELPDTLGAIYRKVIAGKPTISDDESFMELVGSNANWSDDRVKAVLDKIDPDVGHDEWVNVGMALHHWHPIEGKELWNEWSKGSDKFSASGSSKWVNCAGSVQAEAGYKNKSSSAAKEGTAAHELADVCFKDKTEPHSKIGETYEDIVVDEEMVNQVQKYMDYVTSIADMSHSPIQFYEKRVDFSNVVPKGFGTLDSAVYLPEAKALHIFDLKYGRGVRVNAFENTQAILYAIGMLNEKELEGLAIEDIYIHICQPRLNHFDEWHTSPEEIGQWHSVFAKAVELALSENPPRTPSEKACKWCLAKADCPALAQVVENEILDLLEDETVNTLSDERKRRILEAKPLIEQFISSLEEQVMNTLLEGGEFKGFKLIEGRATTKWKAEAEQYLERQYGDKVFNRKLIGVTEARKFIDKQDLERLTEKTSGSPKLVTENTKGKEIYSVKF